MAEEKVDPTHSSKSRVIACDFDGTLCENKFPDIGEPNTEVIEALKAEKASGSKLILWTCRGDKYLDDAVKWCKKHGIEFDALNEDIKEVKDSMKGKSVKVYADEYWDDKAKLIEMRSLPAEMRMELIGFFIAR